MAGYIFGLDSLDSLHRYTRNGVYATKLSTPSGYWKTPHEGTLGDYATMQAGDSIYFFIKRKIYGIGKLVSLGSDCKFFNFPRAGRPKKFDYVSVRSSLLWDEGDFSVNQQLYTRSPLRLHALIILQSKKEGNCLLLYAAQFLFGDLPSPLAHHPF